MHRFSEMYVDAHLKRYCDECEFAEDGREVITWIEGEILDPLLPDMDSGMWKIGTMMRQLHQATASFVLPKDAHWMPLPLRDHGRAPITVMDSGSMRVQPGNQNSI